MQKLSFNSNDAPTLGIELELALVDNQTMALSNSVTELLELLLKNEDRRYKPELMQSCIEINSDICQTVDDARRDLTAKLTMVEQAADSLSYNQLVQGQPSDRPQHQLGHQGGDQNQGRDGGDKIEAEADIPHVP